VVYPPINGWFQIENPIKMDDVGGFLRDNQNNNHGDNQGFSLILWCFFTPVPYQESLIEWWGAPSSYEWRFDWEYRLYMWNCPVPCLITGRYHGDTMGIFHWDIFTGVCYSLLATIIRVAPTYINHEHVYFYLYIYLVPPALYLGCWKQPCKNKGFRLLTKTYVLIIQYV